jgi:hypothetical protein
MAALDVARHKPRRAAQLDVELARAVEELLRLGEPLSVRAGLARDPQAQAIVDGLRLSDVERARTRALRLDADGRVIAASDRRGVLTERLALRTDGQASGYYADGETVVGFAHTPGYETYEGLGWYGAIVQGTAQRG